MLDHRQRLYYNIVNLFLNWVRIVTIQAKTFEELSYSALMWFYIINRSGLHKLTRLLIDCVVSQVHKLIVNVMAMFRINLAVRLSGKPD